MRRNNTRRARACSACCIYLSELVHVQQFYHIISVMSWEACFSRSQKWKSLMQIWWDRRKVDSIIGSKLIFLNGSVVTVCEAVEKFSIWILLLAESWTEFVTLNRHLKCRLGVPFCGVITRMSAMQDVAGLSIFFLVALGSNANYKDERDRFSLFLWLAHGDNRREYVKKETSMRYCHPNLNCLNLKSN